MTQAYNLAILANNVNTSGQLNSALGLTPPLGTGNNVQFNSLGIGTAPTGTSGAISAGAISASSLSASGAVSSASLSASGSTYTASLGVGTGATGNFGQIVATSSIIAGFSDDKLKTNLGNIENALEKLRTLNGFYYEPNETAISLGFEKEKQIGVSAQKVQAVLPEAVKPAPIDNQYLTVQYEKLCVLLIEAVKDLDKQVQELKGAK